MSEDRISSFGTLAPSEFLYGLGFYRVSLAFTEARFTERRIFFSLSRTSRYRR